MRAKPLTVLKMLVARAEGRGELSHPAAKLLRGALKELVDHTDENFFDNVDGLLNDEVLESVEKYESGRLFPHSGFRLPHPKMGRR